MAELYDRCSQYILCIHIQNKAKMTSMTKKTILALACSIHRKEASECMQCNAILRTMPGDDDASAQCPFSVHIPLPLVSIRLPHRLGLSVSCGIEAHSALHCHPLLEPDVPEGERGDKHYRLGSSTSSTSSKAPSYRMGPVARRISPNQKA